LVVEKFDKLFNQEKIWKQKKYTIPIIKEKRNTNEYQKLVDSLHDEIWDIKAQPGSLLEKAVNYAKNSWDELFTYREYGYLEMSNNIAERSVKPFVIARKNFLFSKTENGAQASGVLFSIIQTAKANGLCIERYLEYVLNNINKIKIDDILPWSEKLPKELKLNLK
jgi:transposase